MSGLLNSVDSFDSFLVECFRVPSSTNNNNDLIELTCDSVVESAVDFDLFVSLKVKPLSDLIAFTLF